MHETASVSITTDPSGDAPGSAHEAPARDALDIAALVLAVGLLTATGSFFFVPSFTPRFALLVAAIPLGAWSLVALGRRRDLAAGIGLVALVWTVIGALFAPSPRLALLGVVGNESSALLVFAAMGVWAIGRRASSRATMLAVPAVIAALAVSAGVGALQVIVDAERGELALYDGRATGLTPNPVYFGALMVAGLAMTAHLVGTWSLRRVALGASGFALAANLSGSRIALLTSLLVGVVALVARRGAGRVSAVPLVAAVFGAVAAPLFLRLFDGDGAATDRLGAGGGGRLEVWRLGVDATLDRPLTGWGFGRFHSAVQHGFSSDLVRMYNTTDTRQVYFDAHNVVVGLLVAVGVVGALLFAAFAWTAGRRARGPLAAAAAAIAVTWLLQPLALSTLPVALLLLGLSVDRQPRSDRSAPSRPAWLLVALGAALGLAWVSFDLAADRAADRGDAEALGDLAAMVGDPVLADSTAQLWTYHLDTPGADAEVIRWSQRSIDAEPDSPRWHYLLAYRWFGLGDVEAAQRSLDRSLALQPWHAPSWNLMHAIAVALDDEDLELVTSSAVCRLGLPSCARPAPP